jgi:hypothetical protein
VCAGWRPFAGLRDFLEPFARFLVVGPRVRHACVGAVGWRRTCTTVCTSPASTKAECAERSSPARHGFCSFSLAEAEKPRQDALGCGWGEATGAFRSERDTHAIPLRHTPSGPTEAHCPRRSVRVYCHWSRGSAKNSVKFPLDSYSIVHGGAWCQPQCFHDRRRHAVKTQVVGAEAVDMSDLVWRQPREDFWRDGIALID